ncbi:STAS domain-containing protein [Paenibacillus athensensis]|uniref:Anti-sigma factor antagonist n=1 Tax=Paenibacillus athensensis TaxID=1967502 RepID=A0A4Y8PZF1_9BACL|nr:STAS domain-containing protein [Paenibacillus athensensis]MCD1261209.1 STAS domain-containing protein [Paenibacillus athensensis]
MSAGKFQIEQSELGSAVTLHLHGELDLAAAVSFQAALESVIPRTDKTLILDLAHLHYIDSTGIGILVSAIKARHERKAPLLVSSVPANIQRLFDLTGISPFLNEELKDRA